MQYPVGSLVQARGREWVVLPDTSDDFLVLRPLGGTDLEIAGIYLPLEESDVRPAAFDPPDPRQVGDFISSRLLRDAVRLGFRSSAGPFRSFARINVEPRPYQLVPLLMALKLDPIRLLIADDVGIGKTIEAGLIAREMLDRGEVKRLAVLCPPHLAEQWQFELKEKFHIQAELVLPSTARRLERNLSSIGQSIFDLYPYVIVSTEYIKTSRRRDDFVRTCPEFVIVDEAHTCAFDQDRRSGRHLRHQLVSALSQDPQRHMILVTATPHSGNEGAFRSLLGLLRPDFRDLPQDLSGKQNEKQRREVARHLVQRRRADVRGYMEETVFPEREDAGDTETYNLSPEYQKLFNNILDYARERVLDKEGGEQRQRVRWWSALALLRSLASSPAAAAVTLRNRSGTAETETAAEADAVGKRAVLDLDDAEDSDSAPGGQEGDDQPQSQRERLLRFARRAEALQGPQTDAKLKKATALVKKLLDDGFNPILFCRFIPTAEYVAAELRRALPRKVEVAAVTGTLPPEERKLRVEQLGQHKPSVLVATDCLSEGINLQAWFDAVVHYDLSWNPTRHEQREGRVDRFGQPSPVVRTVTYYGTDNQIDGIVLEVLLRKHKAIRTSLGISVPLPANSSQVVQALMQGLLLRGSKVSASQIAMPFMQDMTAADLQLDWENVSNREKKSRTLFAQRTIKVDEVAQEWKAVRAAIGTHTDVERFVREVVQAHGGFAAQKGDVWEFTLTEKNKALIDACGGQTKFKAGFTLPVPDDTLYLSRTHPLVEGLATYTLETSLDSLADGVAKRCGVIRTKDVDRRTILFLLRFRYHLVIRRGGEETPLLAEACDLIAFRGRANAPEWLDVEEAESLLQAEPAPKTKFTPQQKSAQIEYVLADMENLQNDLNQMAKERSEALKEAHRRVRQAARQKGVTYDVRPNLPPDLLGLYILLPVVE